MRFLSVGGAVRAPGRVPYTSDLTLMSTINAAGGASDFAGDKIRLNAVYDSQQASWYENMGIVMAFLAPGDKSGVDVFNRLTT